MKALLLFFPFALFIVGCSSGATGSAGMAMKSEAMHAEAGYNGVAMRAKASAPHAELASRPVEVGIPRQVIRRAEVAVRVPNVEKAEREVNDLVREWQGYVESANSSDLATDSPVLTMQIRIPVARFDDGIAKLESLGVRLRKVVSSEDVTGQIVDLDARLATLTAQEETYRGLLKRASNLQNVISLQDKLTEVRGTIESMAAQRKTLGGLAALSNITLQLEQDAVAHAVSKDPNWMAQSWGQSTTAMGTTVRFVVTVGMYMAVFSPFWLPMVWLLWRTTRSVRKPAL